MDIMTAWFLDRAPLAHAWLEQRTHNPLVPCSTHGGGTSFSLIKK